MALFGQAVRYRILLWILLSGFAGSSLPGRAQWITQTNVLRQGWNSVFLHVDPFHVPVDSLVASHPGIEEIWYWQPALPTGQFITSPQNPVGTGSQWSSWTRTLGAASPLKRLVGNGAYLVRVANNAAPLTWPVKGRPLAPTYRWTMTGLNFLGFPVPPAPAPSFESFLAHAPELRASGEIYRYLGGNLNNNNPDRVTAFRNTPVARDQAYWVRSGESYNQYFGPLQLVGVSTPGFRFGNSLGQASMRLRNLAGVAITVTLRQVDSEAPPAGQPPIAAAPPILIRGSINATNLTFGYTELSTGPQQWNLAPAGQPGSEVEVVLGLNRSAMNGQTGALFAGILRLTDSLGLSQVDVSVSAEKANTAGLWVGGAVVSYVSHSLKAYAKAANDLELSQLLARLQLEEGANGYHYERDPASGRVLVFGGPENKTGSYLLDGAIKTDSGTVASAFPLRLIFHHDGTTAHLLRKVYSGIGLGSNTVVTLREDALLPAFLATARRMSSVHLPTSPSNAPWICEGAMGPGATLTVTIPLAYNDDVSSNPFLHTYHPDHDNLDAQFSDTLPSGLESYGVTRQMTLTFTAPGDNFNELTQSSRDLAGHYAELITFEGRAGQAREYNALGAFTLKRISEIATLTP
jgi:hypothetical protein